jgi:hypothetical protein
MSARILSLLLVVALAACGGGGGSNALPNAPGHSSMQATSAVFTITVPPKTVSAIRSPKYISVNTQSVIITLDDVNGSAYTGPDSSTATNLTPSNPACVSAGGGLTCTASAPAIPGSDTFTVATYDAMQTSGAPVAGAILSQATLNVNVIAGIANTPSTPLVLNGVASSYTVAFTSDPHISGTQGSGFSIVGNAAHTLTVTTQDASGATIIGPGLPTYTVQSTSGALSIVSSGVNRYTAQVKSFSKTPVTLTITPSLGAVGTVAVTTVQELWVASQGTDVVSGYRPGDATPIPGDAISVLAAHAIAFDANGNLWCTEEYTGVEAFAPGTTTPIAADTISGVSAFGLAFDTLGNVWITDVGNNTVLAYAPGTNVPIAADSLSLPSVPYGLAYDADANLWVSIGSKVYAYANQGSSIPVKAVSSGVNGAYLLAFDTSGQQWIANFSGNTITANSPGNFNPINADTITQASPYGIAFDGNGNLWVSTNTASGAVQAYAPGTTTPIAADAMTGLTYPGPIAFAP